MKLEDFLQFAYENHNTRSISITREFRPNGNIYSIVVKLDMKIDDTQGVFYQNYYDLLVIIDTTMDTISSSFGSKNITIKNDILVDEWSKKFDNLLDKSVNSDMDNLINDAFNNCNSSDITRVLKLKKLIN